MTGTSFPGDLANPAIIGTSQSNIPVETSAAHAAGIIQARPNFPRLKKKQTRRRMNVQSGEKIRKKSARLSNRISPHAISESGGLRLKCGTTMSALKTWPPNQTADQIVASQSSTRDKNFMAGASLRTHLSVRQLRRQNVVEATEQMRNSFFGFVAHVGEAESFATEFAVAGVDDEMMFLTQPPRKIDDVDAFAVFDAGQRL